MTTLTVPVRHDIALYWSVITRRADGSARLDREWQVVLYGLHLVVLGARTTLGLTSVGRHAAQHGRRRANRRAVGLPEFVAHYITAALTWTTHHEDRNDRSALSRVGRVAVNSLLALGTLGALWLVNR